jgi:nicotinate-nucleotide adenylyltransferase
MKRIGIYGGTFSPPHLGHYQALSAFVAEERLDEILVIPTNIPPHKATDGETSAEARLAMCRLAFADLPVTVSDREIRRGGTSYTALTLNELKKDDVTLIFLCGTDMFMSMDTWYRHEEIFALAEIVYATREEDGHMQAALGEKAAHYKEKYGATVRPLTSAVVEISSTELRKAIEAGEDTPFLSPQVKEYIRKWRLYQK